ncbi:ASCH domain-containing protein [Ralstonia pseudosolanacearum]|uniref:hypothetical protein n=1 Tax=Ralstonia pseudosolanacearum TaxID=1310165 RepID=UPI00048AF5A3|nr:hypothetical protein [Ralstonia pseudosolanacearum]MDO3512601.1 ASCH domain-containing protein [Ralstonia pseudosolanacearum]MDO3556354.1 ASCH domain-containing protein [Ralstonia pseudosolanacearum]MDO3576066.1 ASCH domain-containing protein [Ralstonia pseudosolanacearum]MDO3585813.1 ASCH domain-containing protein [Ralstonia pseudosolanacearum]MDO3621777.1 ASCH domain-containing protein [Ralstonia pseudosolanacearum]
MSILVLPLRGDFFDQIQAGTKCEEYRLCTPHWRRRLEGRTFDRIELMRGYPRRDDSARRLSRPWRGYIIKTITHPHFGPEPVQVFAIRVNVTPETM